MSDVLIENKNIGACVTDWAIPLNSKVKNILRKESRHVNLARVGIRID